MIGRYVFRKQTNFFAAFMLDLAGYAFFSLCRLSKKPLPASPKRILVVRLDHLGDVLAASCVPKILKSKYPGSKIIFLTSSAGAAVLKNNPFVDELIIYDAPWFQRSNQEKPQSQSARLLMTQLKRLEIDLALMLRGDLRENYLVWRSRIPHRVGYGITGGGFFLNHEAVYRFGVHESEHTSDLLSYLSIKDANFLPAIYFSKEEDDALPANLKKFGVDRPSGCIGFQVEAGNPSKNWSEENTRKFFSLFADHFSSYKMVLVGTDKNRARRLVEAMRLEKKESSFIDLVGKTPIRDLFLILKNMRGFIGPDSGPAHAAAAMGLPTLFLYSGTNLFNQWKSLAPNADFLRHEVPCSPCRLTECPVSGHPCMDLISPENVLNWLKNNAAVSGEI